MATIVETDIALAQKKKEISQAKENIAKIKATIPQTTASQLRGQKAPEGLAGRDFQRKLSGARGKVSLAETEIGQAETEVGAYEQQFEEYKRTDSGKLQYAKEEGLVGEPIRDRVVKGGTIEIVGYRYQTPYGEVIDWSPKQELLEDMAELEARELGFSSAKEMQEGFAFAKAMGSNVLDTGTKLIPLTQEGVQQLNVKLSEELSGGKYNLKDINKRYGTNIKESDFKQEVRTELPTSNQFNLMSSGAGFSGVGTSTSGIQARQNYRNLFTGFALVSASSDTDLKSSSTSVSNGNANVLSGNVISDISRQQSGAKSGSWINRIIGTSEDFKKGFEEPTKLTIGGQSFREVSAQNLGTVSTLPSTRLISEYDYQVSKGNIPTIGADTTFVEPKSTLGKVSQFTSNIFTEKFRVTPSEVGTNIMSTWTPENIESLGNTVGRKVGEVTERTLTNLGYTGFSSTPRGESIGFSTLTTAPRKTIPQRVSQFGSNIFYRVTGKSPQEVYRENLMQVSDSSGRYLTPSQVSKGAEVVSSVAVQAPFWYGAVGYVTGASYVSRGVNTLREDKIQYGERPKGYTDAEWSAYKKQVDGYNKGKKLGAYMDIGFGSLPFVAKGLQVGARVGKFTKESKFFSEPSRKVVKYTPRSTTNVIDTPDYAKRISSISDEEAINLFPRMIKKGSTVETEIIQTADLVGDIKEIRTTSLFGKPRTFKGKEFITSEGRKEIIQYGDDLFKITTTDEFGKGTVKLIRGSKEIKSARVSSGFGLEDYQRLKARTDKLKVDRQVNQPIDVLEINVNGRTAKEVRTRANEGGEVFKLVDEAEKPFEPDLTSRKVFGQIDVRVESGLANKGKVGVVTSESSGFLDISTASARKGKIQVVTDKGKATIKVRKGVEQVFGTSDEKELVSRVVSDKGTISTRILSLETSRQITEGSETSFTIISGKDTKLVEEAITTAKRKTKPKLFEEVEKIIEVPKKVPVEKQPVINIVNPEYDIPSYLGGGKSSQPTQSLYALEKNAPTLGLENLNTMSGQVVISPTSKFLKGTKSLGISDVAGKIPTNVEIESRGLKVFGVGKVDTTQRLPPQEILMTRTEAKVEVLPLQKSLQQSILQQKDLLQLNQLDLVQQRKQERVQSLEKLNLVQQLKQLQKLETDTVQKQQTKTTSSNRDLFKSQRPFKLKLNLPEEKQSLTKKLAKAVMKEEGFEVFARSKGEDVLIGKTASKQEAVKLLAGELKGTLKASGFIEREGKKVAIEDLGLGGEFTRSKVDPFRIVQKRERRLGTRSETKQIQFFKKTKGGFL